MGRRRKRLIETEKKPKGNKKMGHVYGDGFEYPYAKTTVVNPNLPVITDVLSTKHFGILLTTQQSIEEFQAKSNMLKAFTTEYQYHYWALVARIRINDEILDIAIPTVLYNYRQTVSGASVSFHLNDVEAMSNATAPMAEAIANVLIQSSFGQKLSEMFGNNIEWINAPVNTCHVHPGQMSVFSGTDYSKTVNDPGICFPLIEPHEDASFSSIICHDTTRKNIAKIVRTEYRFANRDGNKINYLHGSCIAYFRGYSKTRTVTYPPIQSLFKNKRDEVIDESFPSYFTTDGNGIVLQNNEMLEKIIEIFNEIDFSPNTDNVKAENIEKPVYGYQANYGGGTFRHQHNQHSSYTPPVSVQEMERKCIEAGFDPDMVKKQTYKDVKALYENVIATEKLISQKSTPALAAPATISVRDAESMNADYPEEDLNIDMSFDEKIKYLLENGVLPKEVMGKNERQINAMMIEVMAIMEDFEDDDDSDDTYEIYSNEELIKTMKEEELELQSQADLVFGATNTIQKTSVKNDQRIKEFVLRVGVSEATYQTLSEEDIVKICEHYSFEFQQD